jgi:ATP/maltotriose-dependent transcriptional regulator MalT/DNA-binding SARP family transcriptional activator
VSGYPVQSSKIQRPPLRDETLARDRLLDWLHAKIHHRIVYVIAEAGYGKTTLLADFSRRTRYRTLWYRLDADDGHWLAFLSHLVAAGREQDPDFAPVTSGLLREVATGGPSLEGVLESFLRELGAMSAGGAIVILDDFHLVDDAADIRQIMRELVARAPERITFVIASRRTPNLPVARLRGQGEVAELGTDDLRFNQAETEQLFRETYGRPLEPDVLNDLSRRTEGWAASLQLVQAAIRGRTAGEVRSFVRSLSGAEGELYDYLAEEVIGSLPAELQDFVMRASYLEVVDPDYTAAAFGTSPVDARRLVDGASKAGLLSRRESRTGAKFHPLVREFLRERFSRTSGEGGVRELHVSIASAVAHHDWRTAARHFIAGGDTDRALTVIRQQLATIASQGAYDEAAALARDIGGLYEDPAVQILNARVDLQRGALADAAARANEALRVSADRDSERAIAMATLLTVAVDAGDGEAARRLATSLAGESQDPTLLAIADAVLRLTDVSADGDLGAFRASLALMAERQLEAGQLHYYGITMLNISECLRAEGRFHEALDASGAAIDALERSSAGMELAMAHGVHAWSMAHLYGVEAAALDREAALTVDDSIWRLQIAAELADVEGFYGDPSLSPSLLEQGTTADLPPSVARPLTLSRIRSSLRLGLVNAAREQMATVDEGVITTLPGFRSSVLATRALVAAAAGDGDSTSTAHDAVRHAQAQGAGLWREIAEVALIFGAPEPPATTQISKRLESPTYLSMTAELVVRRLDWFTEEQMGRLLEEIRRRPTRWRGPLRSEVVEAEAPRALRAAKLLDEVGDSSDIALLRTASRRLRRLPSANTLGRRLSRRLANKVFVEDLGRIHLRIGERTVFSAGVRRKVLALLCFLLVQRDMSATRDQVLDALWPDQDPSQALNSLNQTLYFLRRVIEPAYEEDLSPGYVHHSAEIIWLDPELVTSRSTVCRIIVRNISPDPTPDEVDGFLREYVGRFALDFEYEEWAAQHRDWLHSAYLEVVERSIHADTGAGHYSRAIRTAQRALEVDPEAEQVERSLLRLYRLTGAHAAAAEQYAHYSAMLKNTLGVDPPPLDAI